MTKENNVAVREGETPERGGALITKDAFDMTFEQAKHKIENTLQMYNLVRQVASRILGDKDKYYMSTINNPKGKPKDGELEVVAKSGVDKILGFFRIETHPTEEKIDGGYKVTVKGYDKSGGYLGSGVGICTRYEKKYAWIKADNEEYDAADEQDRRTVERKGKHGNYKVKQIKTDERAIAHTLVSMATKRARAGFLKTIFPDLDDFSFEGEGSDADFQYNTSEQTPSNTVLTDDKIKEFYEKMKKVYSVSQIKEAFREITGSEKLGGMTEGVRLDINTYLIDNFPGGKSDA